MSRPRESGGGAYDTVNTGDSSSGDSSGGDGGGGGGDGGG